jgi:hypothetical protein
MQGLCDGDRELPKLAAQAMPPALTFTLKFEPKPVRVVSSPLIQNTFLPEPVDFLPRGALVSALAVKPNY